MAATIQTLRPVLMLAKSLAIDNDDEYSENIFTHVFYTDDGK